MFTNLGASSVGQSTAAPHLTRFLDIFTGAANFIVRYRETRRQIRALAKLDDHLLRDVGLSRADVERACSATFWMRHLSKPQRNPVRLGSYAAFLVAGLLVVSSITQALSQEVCKPSLTTKESGHSDVVNFQRKWTGVFAVDASRCSTAAGPFDIEFVRLKEVGPDLSFTEKFTWRPEQVEVGLDLSWDEWVSAYRIGDVASCPCRN
jgi:uncharacterized protein YjiS (DUF1127 family)